MTPLLGTKTSSAPASGAAHGRRHETRNGLSVGRPVAAFLRVVARYGAAMARHGRHRAPRAAVRAPSAPATGPFGFSRNPRHGFAWRAARGALTSQREFRGFHEHETRDTNHGLYAFHETRVTAFIAARSLLSCALWRNGCAAMAWLWSGCGACGAAMAMARHGRPWSGMGGILPPRQRPCSRQPFSVALRAAPTAANAK